MGFKQLKHLVNIKMARTLRHRAERLNKREIMNCGVGATIVDYQTTDNITVKFDDGAIVYNQRYRNFKNGLIAHPEIKCCRSISINEYIILWYLSKMGFRKALSGSLKDFGFGMMELDCYNPDLKIAVEYDGVRWHKLDKKQSADDKKNKLCASNGIYLIRIREPGLEPMPDCENFILDTTAPFSQSLERTLNILIRRMNTSIKIDFGEDKETILNSFSDENKFSKVGEVAIASNGELMKIIAYRTNQDIDVEFESGVVIRHKRYDHFKAGSISKESEKYHDKEKARLNARERMNCCEYATIIRYKNTNDIDVKFDDGTVVEHRRYREFKNGNIKNPNRTKTVQ